MVFGEGAQMRTRRLAAAAAALLLTVGSCTSDDPPTGTLDDPHTTNDDRADDEPDQDPPEDAGDDITAEDLPRDQLETEIDEFVATYYAEINSAARTGDTSALRSMVSEDCRPCWGSIETIEEAYAANHQIEGGRFSEDLEIDIGDVAGNTVRTLVGFSHEELRIVDANGNEVRSVEAGEFTFQYDIVRDGDGNYSIEHGADYT